MSTTIAHQRSCQLYGICYRSAYLENIKPVGHDQEFPGITPVKLQPVPADTGKYWPMAITVALMQEYLAQNTAAKEIAWILCYNNAALQSFDSADNDGRWVGRLSVKLIAPMHVSCFV